MHWLLFIPPICRPDDAHQTLIIRDHPLRLADGATRHLKRNADAKLSVVSGPRNQEAARTEYCKNRKLSRTRPGFCLQLAAAEALVEAEQRFLFGWFGMTGLVPALVEFLAQSVAVISHVAEHMLGRLRSADQALSNRVVVGFIS